MRKVDRAVAKFSLVVLSIVSVGCGTITTINGEAVSENELQRFRVSWRQESLTTKSKSKIASGEHQGIFDMIAASEARGATKEQPCSDLTLVDIVHYDVTGVRFGDGTRFNGLDQVEQWRVMACGNKHTWTVLDGTFPTPDTQVIYAKSKPNEWAQLDVVPRGTLLDNSR